MDGHITYSKYFDYRIIIPAQLNQKLNFLNHLKSIITKRY